MPATSLAELATNTLRVMSMEAVQQANSGHPGAPMALAPLTHMLFRHYLRHNPANPEFPNRDRFVLSNGHASMLLYSTLHLAGYDVTLDDIRAFRQLHSRTPGHPEFGHTPGVETTTGPLGQGAANSVGMAIAEKWLAARFNRPEASLVDYRVYALLGDGCMMEGVTGEAASLAGHLQLDNLTWFYDDNSITIDGPTGITFTESVAERFAAYGWFVQRIDDIEDGPALAGAIEAAIAEPDRPSLVITPSVIGRGAPTRQNTARAHGEPLGEDELRGAKAFYGWPTDEPFHVPEEVYADWTEASRARGAALEAEWQQRLAAYAAAHPGLATEWSLIQGGLLPSGWADGLPQFPADAKGMATRAASGKVLAAAAPAVPWLIGGSADLAGSNKTTLPDTTAFAADAPGGRTIHFGVREHAMVAVCNGLALSKLRPFAATFLVFSDYCRPAIRLAALMKLPVTLVMTHDSIGVGEDGPTHQPIEHLAALRTIPGLDVFRPGDANETTAAWEHVLATPDRPVLLALSRQSMPVFEPSITLVGARRGGYVLRDPDGAVEVILIGTGSELSLCTAAGESLAAAGMAARVVSMPCIELFERQEAAYRDAVLPPAVTARVAVEAGVRQGWDRYVGSTGAVIAMDSFGVSAPGPIAMEHFGFTVDAVVAAARAQVARAGGQSA